MNGKILQIVIILITIAVFITAVVFLIKRARHGSACCGEHAKTEKRNSVSDKNKSHYPYSVNLAISGMTCKNCAIKIENTLNEREGIWAKVDRNKNSAFILSKSEINTKEICAIIARAGYLAEIK